MNLCLFGATGRVGTIILENALSHHFKVNVLVRDQNRVLPDNPDLQIIEGNVLNESDITAAINGTTAVISSLNTDGTTTLSESIPLIIRCMKKHGVKRIITIGTAGILQARINPQLYRFQSSESKRKTTRDAEEHLKAYMILKESGLDWTIVCPTYLPLGERVGRYRIEKNFLPKDPSSISVYDTADFAFQQLFSDEYYGCRVGITY